MVLLFLFSIIFLLFGCTNKKQSVIKDEAFEIPKFKNPRPIPPKPKYPKAWMKKISLTISKNMSTKDVISHIANSTGININLEGIEDVVGISYSASNISFLRALKCICRLCGWRIKINNIGDISVLKDSNYFYTHEVAFLSYLRKMKLSTSIEALGKISDNSSTQLYSENESNLWNEIEQNLKFLLRDDKSRYTVNKQGGLIIVNATQAEHEEIAFVLHKLYVRVASQAFVQARNVEVSLDEAHADGISWDMGSMIKAGFTGDSTAAQGVVQSIAAGIDFLKTFGSVKTLANPSTFVLNNQFAIFQAVENRPNFKLSLRKPEVQYNKPSKKLYTSQDTISSEMSIVPIGIIFIIQPSIDFTNRSVTLCIKKTRTTFDKGDNVEDPAVAIMSGGKTKSEFPIVKEKSIDTIINVKDGETAIIGGLIQKEETPAQFGIQNGKFGAKTRGSTTKEMVMLIKVNIVEPETRRTLSMSECEIIDPEGI